MIMNVEADRMSALPAKAVSFLLSTVHCLLSAVCYPVHQLGVPSELVPIKTRTITGMLELLPGASPAASLHRTKDQTGTVSYGGSSGGNVAQWVDGADNRDNHYSGPLMSFTTESLEQFQLSTNQFSAVRRSR